MATTTPLSASSAERFERMYLEAKGETTAIPWSDGVPNPALVAWLDVVAPTLVRCGARIAVVGCGLGEDARELIRRGYDVTAFDVSPTAVEWARSLDPGNASCYCCADVLDPPPRWRHRFDLVVEIYTLQSLPPDHRRELLAAIADLVAPKGHLLAICRGSTAPVGVEDGPPWALTESELLDLAENSGLAADTVHAFTDDQSPPRLRIRALLHRA